MIETKKWNTVKAVSLHELPSILGADEIAHKALYT